MLPRILESFLIHCFSPVCLDQRTWEMGLVQPGEEGGTREPPPCIHEEITKKTEAGSFAEVYGWRLTHELRGDVLT